MGSFNMASKFFFLSVLLAAASTWAQDSSSSAVKGDYGVYFDSASGNYFSNSNPQFVIRPVGDAKYVDRIEVSINDGSFEDYSGALKLGSEGLHTIKFRAVDPVLNWSPVQTFRVFVDLNAPTSSFSWQGKHKLGDNTYVSSEATLSLSAEDNLSGVKKIVTKNGDKPLWTVSGPLRFPKEGPYELIWAAVDNVGNMEGWRSYKFFVDTTPPKTKLKVQGTSSLKSQRTFINYGTSAVLEGADTGAGVQFIEYKINNGPITRYSSPIVFSEPASELRYRAVDWVGNEEPWQMMAVYQDTAPPVLAVEKVGPHTLAEGKIFVLPGFSFKVSASDAYAGMNKVLVSHDGKSFSEAKEEFEHKFTQAGVHHFQVKATDKVNNSAESAPFIVVVDNKAPVTKIKPRQALVQKGEKNFLSGIPNMIDILGEDEGVGLKYIEYSYDGKSWSQLKGPIDLATWDYAKQTLFYRGIDGLGNREPAQSLTIEILRNGPKVDLFVESDGLPNVPLKQIGDRKPAKKE
jgi:hypothetical protein